MERVEMRVLTIQASPRDTGNTATILGWVEDELKSAGHEVERVELARLEIRDCQGCYYCQSHTNFGDCKQKDDDANLVFEKMGATDAIVIGSPLYCWSFTATVHALFNRSISLARNLGTKEHKSMLEGKRAAMLVTCAGPREGNADLVGPLFERECNFLKLEKAGELIVPMCMEPAVLEDDVKEKAANLARELVG
jgi:multimeric flavodoxin WrbA